jgi:hypothetical protein
MEHEVGAATISHAGEPPGTERDDDGRLSSRVAALEASLRKLRVWMLLIFAALAGAGIFAAQFLWKNTSNSFDALSESFQKQIEQRLGANRANLQAQLDTIRRQVQGQSIEPAGGDNK